MKPYVICYMMMSLDGRIDCEMTEKISGTDEYYDILSSLDYDSTAIGKTTVKMHYVNEVYKSKSNEEISNDTFYKVESKNGYTIIFDTFGTLKYDTNIIDEKTILAVISKKAKNDYLDFLKKNNISFIVVGDNSIDLNNALSMMYKEFNIKRICLVGGGTINGSFLSNGLIDEVITLIGPAIDGRNMVSIFDNIDSKSDVFKLKLLDLKRYDNDALLLKYKVIK